MIAGKIIVVITAYDNDHVKSLDGQAAVLPFIADVGADGVEIRRELCSVEEFNASPSLAAIIERHGLLAYYSVPQVLFADNDELSLKLPALLAEAQILNALRLKLPSGYFLHNQQLDGLREIFRNSGMALVVENDQTDCSQLTPIQHFRTACQVHQLPVILAFDMGNWLWVGDSPEETACHLAPAVSYAHVKTAGPHHEKLHAVPPDQAADRWLALFDNLPADAPYGIESPLTGHDLTAVTHRYVSLLCED